MSEGLKTELFWKKNSVTMSDVVESRTIKSKKIAYES